MNSSKQSVKGIIKEQDSPLIPLEMIVYWKREDKAGSTDLLKAGVISLGDLAPLVNML